MKKKTKSFFICFVLVSIFVLLLVLCGEEGDDNTENKDKTQISKVRSEAEEYLSGKDIEQYSNLNFECKTINVPETDEIHSLYVYPETISQVSPTKENISKLVEILKKIIGNDFVFENVYFYDVTESDTDKAKIVADDYERLSIYEVCPPLIYSDYDNFKEVEINMNCIYATKGKIGKYVNAHNAFIGDEDFTYVKSYICATDDLSDKYKLLDGEKSIEEAKKEIEEYFDQITIIDNSDVNIKNSVVSIDVYKIPDEDIYVYHADRTFSYDNINFKVIRSGRATSSMMGNETGIMAEAFMIESGSVDVFLGIMNTYSKVEEKEKYIDIVSFESAVSKVSEFLANQTVFKVKGVSIEYRLFYDKDVDYLEAVPYWLFTAENETDKSTTYVYVDLNTGETTGNTVK